MDGLFISPVAVVVYASKLVRKERTGREGRPVTSLSITQSIENVDVLNGLGFEKVYLNLELQLRKQTYCQLWSLKTKPNIWISNLSAWQELSISSEQSFFGHPQGCLQRLFWILRAIQKEAINVFSRSMNGRPGREMQITYFFFSQRSSIGWEDPGEIQEKNSRPYMILTNQNIGSKRGDILQETSKAVCLGLIAFKLTYKLQTSPGHNIGSISNHIFAVGFILY